MSRVVWTWWDRGESEDGLLGFHTKKERDAYSAGKPGPFRRRMSPEGRTVPATETWGEMINRLEREALDPRHD